MPGRKRSKVSTGTGTPSAKRARSKQSKWSRSKFGQVMEAGGLILGEGDQENLLRKDPAVFQRDVASALKRSSAANVTIDEFMQSFREYLDSPTRFKSTLMPTGIAEGADIRVRFGGLDSLMRMLLGVDVLQPLVMDALLEWLPDYMSDGDMGDLDLQEYLLMPKLMLSQLRMLDHLVNGKDLCDKLLEVVEIAPREMKREIITALPEILDDPQHNDAAQKLKTIMETNSDLTAAIVDALSNLNIANDIAAEALDVAINSLQSAHISDLPTVIKFINEHLTPKNTQEVMSEVREKLNLDFSPAPIISSTPLTQPKQDSKSSDYFIVLDTIRSSICFQRVVADGWIKAINAVTSAEDHRVIDIFVLFVLHSITAHKKTIEKTFASKIKASCFSSDLMNSVFGSHPGALRDFFPSILQLCECLLCSLSPSISRFAATLYQHLFTSFEDKYCRQDVVDALVVHINNGVKSEVDQALDVLLALLEHHCKSMLFFIPLIKTVLDYLGHFNMSQIRKLYQVFSILAFADLDNTSALQTELHNIIRKQLTHFESRYRRIGVIGSVMIIHEIARHADMCEVTLRETASFDVIKGRRKDMAKQVLEEAMKTCSHSRQCSILFSDEMCLVVSELDSSILAYLCEEITTSFQDTFLVEVTDGFPEGVPIPMEFLYGLDPTDEGSIALNLLPMIVDHKAQPGGGVVSEMKLLEMAAKFHLLRTCEQQLNSNLEGIDALLGCPVLMCSDKILSRETFEDLPESQRADICLCIFYCINWFRELVCAFAMETEIEMRGKVMVRLQTITDLQDQLEMCMTATPGFWPPSVSMSEDDVATSLRKTRISKNNVTLASMTAAAQSIDKDATAMDKTPTTPTIPIDRLRPYFRELDLSVFKVFQFECLSRTILDSEAHTKEQEELRLKPSQLIFLLQDLCSKLTSSFTTFGPKVVKGDSALKYSSADLAQVVTELMPALCEHLENTSSYFQSQLAENDGVMDAGGSGVEYPQRCLCFHLLLKSLYSFFAWPSLSDPHYSKELQTCLVSILSRTNQGSSQLPSALPQMAHGACKYLQRFSDFLPTLSCGHVLAKLLVAICKTCKAADIKPFISRACGSLLQRPWKAAESGVLKKEALCFLLKYHIEWASEPLVVVEELVGDASGELIGEDTAEASEKYPTMTSATFPCFYRTMMSSLVTQLKAIPVLKTQTDLDKLEDNFYILQVSIKVFAMMVNLVQSFNKKAVLLCVLKVGRLYIEAFIKSGMPILNTLFRPRKDAVMELLKTLQHSTRYLQHCCGHSKVAKDTNLINNVPLLKKTLETLLFRVKELMANHNCQEAFWMGNLKNRDLKGQEILSQLSQQSTTKEEEESTEDGSECKDDLLDLDSDFSEDETAPES